MSRVFKVHNSTIGAQQNGENIAWPREDIDVLIEALKRGSRTREIHSLHFPHRTLENVKMKATVVYPSGLVGWSEEDTLKLIACRSQGDSFPKIQAEHFPERSVSACKMKYKYATKVAPSVPASRRRPRQPWTAHDDEQVMSLRDQGKTAGEIREVAFPMHSVIALKRHMTRLDANRHPKTARLIASKPWSAEEKLRLQELHGQGAAVSDISLMLNRSDSVIRLALESTNLKANRATITSRRRWSEEECELLEPFLDRRANHNEYVTLARRWNRTPQSVFLKIGELRRGKNQSRVRTRRTWTAEESLDLDSMYAQGLPWAKIAKRFDCPIEIARAKLRRSNRRRPEHERPKRTV